jgi:hypothetical protein
LSLAFLAAVAGTQTIAQAQEIPNPTVSTTTEEGAVQYSGRVNLAYIIGPDDAANQEDERGLESLASRLIERTAVEPAGVIGLDIEKDNIDYFPFIYWHVSANTQPLSPAAQRKVQQYLNNGGFIMFDTVDIGSTSLRNVLGDIGVKPLQRMSENHTLTKSFYLVAGAPGTNPDGSVWVEDSGPKGAESVSSVMIAARGWSGAWAGTTLPAGSRDQEMAYRAGINAVMYALTGQYKDDQAHAPAILERLGK